MKTVFFTGATGDLGSLCVAALSDTGRWKVFAAGTNEEKLADLGRLRHVVPVKADVTSSESVIAARDAILCHTSSLDAVVNFAGLGAFNSMVEGDCIQLAERVLAVNTMGPIRVNRILFDLIHRGRGRILNCSSEAGWMTSQPFAAPYFLSKRAVEAYSDSLRRELMFIGIPVVKIQPGSYHTGLTQGVFEQYGALLESTTFYKRVLSKLKALMVWELNRKNDPARLARVVLHALEAKRPRLQYRVGTGKLLSLLELLPEKCVDYVYLSAMGRTKVEKSKFL